MKGIVNSPKHETTRNKEPIRLVTGVNSSTNENIVGNIEDEPIPIRAMPHHNPVSDELPVIIKICQNNEHCIKSFIILTIN